MITKLNLCKQGKTVKIVKVDDNNMLKSRLLEMGFTKNSEIEIIKYAPLKDPIEVKIKNYNISLRVKEAEHIIVEDSNE